MLHLVLLLGWLLPASRTKNRLLTRLGHRVHPSARVEPNLVWKVQVMALGPGAQIYKWNVFKNMRLVQLGENALIGRFNLVSAHPAFERLYRYGAELRMGRESFVTSLHHLDCSGSFTLGELSALAGHQTRVMTHSIDLRRNAQAAYPIAVGSRSFVSARCLLLGGATLPERSVLAAGSTLIKGSLESGPGLYAGSPAKFKWEIAGAWFDREQSATTAFWDPETESLFDYR